MAVKIVRQMNKIAVLGAPMSAAALASGSEGAPSALRSAGLLSKLQAIGYDVTDLGDDPPQLFQEDNESPRARNLKPALKGLEALRPRVEIAAKSGALPLILGGGCSIALGTVAGLRRYFRHVSVIYVDADADLQTPATTTSGFADGMVVSHLVGRGASEMVRFWGEPPLVREPDLALFGVSRLDPAEEQTLQTSPLRRYLAEDIGRKTPMKSASEAVERVHGDAHEFVLHLDVDAIESFQATDFPAASGLNWEELRQAFEVFMAQKHLAAVEVTGYNPSRDSDGTGAKKIIDFLVEALATRKEKAKDFAAPAAESAGKVVPSTAETAMPVAEPGQAWSSDMLDGVEPTSEDESLSENHSATEAFEPEEPHS